MATHPDDHLWTADLAREVTAPEHKLTLRWLGAAGYELTAAGITLLVDPYVTRASRLRTLLHRLEPDLEAIEREVPRADAVVVSHSYFDHVLDVPAIAERTECAVYGSHSTASLLRAAGIPRGHIYACSGGEAFEVGPFRVGLVPSLHSASGPGGRGPFPGDIDEGCALPMRMSGYRCGRMFGVDVRLDALRIFHLGSANLADEALEPGGEVDFLLMAIAGRTDTDRYVERVVARLKPKVLIPTHYDDFFRPAWKPLKLLPQARFDAFVEEVRAVDPSIRIATLPIGGRITLEPASRLRDVEPELEPALRETLPGREAAAPAREGRESAPAPAREGASAR